MWVTNTQSLSWTEISKLWMGYKMLFKICEKHTCVYVYVQINVCEMYKNKNIYIYIKINIYMCVYIYVCACVYIYIYIYIYIHTQIWASQFQPVVKNPPPLQETQERWVRFLGWEDPLEKEMATHSSILVWEILWTEEPDGLLSMGLKRAGHAWSSWARTAWTYTNTWRGAYREADITNDLEHLNVHNTAVMLFVCSHLWVHYLH